MTAGDDVRWHAHYENAAERLFPGKSVLSEEEDRQCVKDADQRLREDIFNDRRSAK